jgi:hypothetical protein
LSAAFLGTGFLMLSCASSLRPDPLTVHVPGQFSGTLHVSTCVSSAPAGEITVDDRGLGKTALCPAVDRTVEIEVIASDRQYRLAAADVRIERTGDGIATSIEASLPK